MLGSLCSAFHVEGQDLSNLIREELGMRGLFLCDGVKQRRRKRPEEEAFEMSEQKPKRKRIGEHFTYAYLRHIKK